VQERFINSLAADYRSRLGSLPRTRTTKFNFTFANYYSIIYKHQDVTQLVECDVWGVDVVGSSPIILTQESQSRLELL
jgi:hypothetical protein